MSDLYQIFLSEVRAFEELKLSNIAIYAGILSLSRLPYNPMDLFSAIRNIEIDLLTLQSSGELASNVMYRISLGLLEDAQIMIELLRTRDYEKLKKLIFYSKSEEVKQDCFSNAPKPLSQKVNNIPSAPSQFPASKNPISESAPVRCSDKLSLESFKNTQGEPTTYPPASSKSVIPHPSADISSSYLSKPIHVPIPRPASPKIKINPFAQDSPDNINSSLISSVSSDLSHSTSIPSTSCSILMSHTMPLPINNSLPICEVCNQIISGERINTPNCSHKFHKGCLIDHIQLIYAGQNVITCPALNCSQNITTFISGYLPRSVKPLPVARPAIFNPLSCPNCNIMISNDGSPGLTCTQCNITFCRECRNEYHVGIPCWQVKGNPKRDVKQFNSSKGPERLCQTCGVMLEILKPGELIRCTKCRTGHCGECYMSQFQCVCDRYKANIGVRQT